MLLVTLDTTRADRLGCYGNRGALTPVLDRLAANGVLFSRALCQAPLTLPSHASLLTSTHPPSNGLRINGGGVLSEELPTLAAVLETRGFRTGAFVGALVLDSNFGLARGFERYDDNIHQDPQGLAERPANQVVDAALRWLDGLDSREPFLAWVHFFDPHHPYEPPPGFRDLPDPYDGEIAFTDAQLNRLVTWLDANGRRENTLIVIAGDHGEAFEEHGEAQHGLFLYNPTVHVPLILSCPELLPQAQVVSSHVGLVDVMPTVLDLIGVAAPPGLEGFSLAPACRGEPFAGEPVYAESRYPRAAFGWAQLRSLTAGRLRYIDAPSEELYDLESDPGELRNLAPAQPESTAEMRGLLEKVAARMRPMDASTAGLDPGVLQRLASLGYVTPAGDDGYSDEGRQDPKDMVEVYRAFMRARAFAERGEHADVVRLLEPPLRENPDSGAMQSLLGKAYAALGRHDEARLAFRASLDSRPDDPDSWCGLGDALFALGHRKQGFDCYRQALDVAPEHAPAHSRLGRWYAESGDFETAYVHFRYDADLRPGSPNALTNLANVELARGRHGEAVVLAQQALELDQGYVPAHSVLWRALEGAGDRAAAIAALRRAHEVLPNNVVLSRSLAWLLATTPDLTPMDRAVARELALACDSALPDDPATLDVLAAAEAAVGDVKLAQDIAMRAHALAVASGNGQLAAGIQQRLDLYRAGSAVFTAR